jgi:hypothetical protein
MIENGKIVKDWKPEYIGRLYHQPYFTGVVSYDMERLQDALLHYKQPLIKRVMYLLMGKLN